jgi:hypothetical protein
LQDRPTDAAAPLAHVRASFYSRAMPADDKLTPADPRDLADSIAFALRFEGRKRKHDAAEYMAAIAAERVVRHLECAGFVVMKKAPLGGHSAVGRGFEG